MLNLAVLRCTSQEGSMPDRSTHARCGYYLWDDPREKALRDAVYACVTAT